MEVNVQTICNGLLVTSYIISCFIAILNFIYAVDEQYEVFTRLL